MKLTSADNQPRICGNCRGSGIESITDRDSPMPDVTICQVCNGSGILPSTAWQRTRPRG